MADEIEATGENEMKAGQVADDEKPSTDVEELKKSVAEDAVASEDVDEKANPEQEEEEEYVLKDEADEEEENQKDGVNGHHEEKDDQTSGLGDTVAKHYNNIPDKGKDARKQSRIFYLRNFNNWVKSVLINEFLEKAKKARRRYDEEITVLDLGCGKGGDLLKWQKGRVGHVICADIAEASVEQCRERYDNLKKGQRGSYRDRSERLFSIECIAADCTKVNLKDKLKNSDNQLDLASCQFAFHYAFESYNQAETMLRNACESLRPGGYFIGTTPDANELVKRLKKADGTSFGNEVYNVEFESKDSFDVFGTKYHFKLHEVVDCPEFLVYFPIVEKIASKYNMRLVYKTGFHELFNEKHKDYGNLLHKMQALEGYPPRKGWCLVSDNEEDYAHVKEHYNDKSGKENVIGTLTKDEWEAAGLYLAFAFEKIDPEEEARKEEAKKEEERKEEARKEKSLKRAASPEKSEEQADAVPPSKKTRESEDGKEEESAVDGGAVEESASEEPAAEEPAVEEPAAEEPQGDDQDKEEVEEQEEKMDATEDA